MCNQALILSQVAKLFDPLGLLGPIIVKTKIMIQHLWKAGVSWDGSIPADIYTMWLNFKEQLPLLANISFCRLIARLILSKFKCMAFVTQVKRRT